MLEFRNFTVRTAFVVSVVFCGLLFTGCGDSPSKVVTKALNAAVKKDADTYFKYVYNPSESLKKFIYSDFEEDPNYWNFKFEIQDERIFNNGEKAEVIVKVSYKDRENRTEEILLIKTSGGWKISMD